MFGPYFIAVRYTGAKEIFMRCILKAVSVAALVAVASTALILPVQPAMAQAADPAASQVQGFYDALTADRPYRDAMPLPKALAILEGEVGKAVDADCFDALKKVVGVRPAG